ncbi:hypothetical protein M1615_03455 [Patescibacteria group bacterium]|nr:hypothetical protein [Patescibacteria group bacterium]MCL5010332.1 hypothetical protein [Patescibacteria group bacterium]
MTKEINLLPLGSRPGHNKKRGLILFRWISFSFLILVVVSSLISLILNYFSPIPALKNREVSLLSEFAPLNNKIAKYLYLKDRITKIKTIFATRGSLSKDVNLLETQLPSGLSINSLSIDKKKVNVTVSAFSLVPVSIFLDKIVKLTASGKAFSSVSLLSLGLNPLSGNYSLTLSLDFL